MIQSNHTILKEDLGLIGYHDAYAIQLARAERVAAEDLDGFLLVVEHKPVLTVARLADPNDLKMDIEEWRKRGVEVVETNRGGKITYHGPGQIVLYPILNLRHFGLDLHSYVHSLAEVGIRLLAHYGVEGARDPDHIGVWVGLRKIQAIGVHVRRWVSTHGLAININNSSDVFGQFVACGIHDRGVVSLRELLDGQELGMDEAKARICRCFEEVFDAQLR